MSHRVFMMMLGGLAIAVTCFFLMGMAATTGWLMLRPAKPTSEALQRSIITVAPVQETATSTPSTILSPPTDPGSTPAPLESTEATPLPPATTLPADTPSETAVPEPTLALPSGSVNAVTQEGVATKLLIPKLDVEAPITLAHIEDGTWQVDHLGAEWVGHLEGTAPAGSDSNMVLAAHVTVRRGVYGPFAGLSLLVPGDEIVVYEDETAYRYRVRDMSVVDRTAVNVTYPTSNPELTLITCSRWSEEDGRYLDRLVVKGDLVAE